ncbi:MAG: GMC family oxidoreductase N-terminal domain-containing protein, partial [Pseudomonadota bacterium]
MSALTRRSTLAGLVWLSTLAAGKAPETRQFDTLIIGAGTAGAALAARLSEDSGHKVGVLEAGSVSTEPGIDNPARWFALLGSDLVFKDMTAPQQHVDGKVYFAPHGKLVGGSGAINAMIHHRPTPGDLNDWGLPGWGWDDLVQYFEGSETWLGDVSDARGSAGPVSVMPMPGGDAFSDAVLAA